MNFFNQARNGTVIPHHLAQRVAGERSAILFRETPANLRLTVIFAAVILWILGPFTDTLVCVFWWILLMLATALRYALILAWRKSAPTPEKMAHWTRSFIALTIFSGLMWGMLGTNLFPKPTFQTAVFVFTFQLGVIATGIFTLGSSVTAYSALCISIALPTVLNTLDPSEHEFRPYAMVFVVYCLACCMNVVRLQRNFTELILLRLVHGDLAADRTEAMVAAQDANRAKSQFLAKMSHEIRTPLNGVMGMAQVVLSGPLVPQQRERMGTLFQSAEHLMLVINDILDFSKVEAGQMNLVIKPTNLHRIFHDATDLLAIRARNKGLEFELFIDSSLPAWIDCDPVRIKQIINNLVGNAVKFTKHGSVQVIVKHHADPVVLTPQLRIEVIDTGAGITADERKQLFEPFVQLHEGKDTVNGTGLGLSISRELVRLMGGEIGAESAPNQGSRFWFTLPYKPSETPLGNLQEVNGFVPLSGHVLLVEDSPINMEVASAMLQSFGLQVSTAESGEAAVEMFTRNDTAYSLVLMDCHLPGIDGYEATRQIRDFEAKNNLPRHPIVALTANAIEGDRQRCLDAGMDDYLSKPYKQSDLHQMVLQNQLNILGLTKHHTEYRSSRQLH